MGLPIPPFDPNAPIPNNPFYAEAQFSVTGPEGPLVIGTGLEVVNASLNVTGGSGLGTVTCVNTGAGLTGGPITTTGTIALSTTGVTANSYIFPSLTVDTYGRITAISDGSVATETALGVVQLASAAEVATGTNATKAITSCTLQKKLSDAVNNPSSTCIASSAAVKIAYDSATGGIQKSTITAKGDLIGGTGSATVAALPLGTEGQTLVVCSACATGLTWRTPVSGADIPCAILTARGSLISATAPGTPSQVLVGADGYVLTANSACASGIYWTNSAGIPCAALTGKGSIIAATAAGTPADVAVGVDGQILTADSTCTTGVTWAINPAILCTAITGKGALITGTGAAAPIALPVGTDGQTLVACSTESTGLIWSNITAAIECSTLTAKGDIIVASGPSTPVALPAGTDGQVLKVCAACASGLYWDTDIAGADIPCSLLTQTGQLIVAASADTPIALSVGTNGQILTPNATCAGGLEWIDNPSISETLYATTGDILVAANASDPVALPIGTDGQVLKVCALCTTTGGVYWATDEAGADIPCSLLTAKGDIVVSTAANTPFALPVGTDGQVLKACSTESSGLVWATDEAGADIPCSLLTATGDIIYASAVNTPAALPIGGDGQVLKACSACTGTGGLTWATDEAGADIPCSVLAAKGTLITAAVANTPYGLPVGADGFVLKANSACVAGMEWGTDVTCAAATPIVEGVVFGCTTTLDTDPVALGYNALVNETTGSGNTAIGYSAQQNTCAGFQNTAVGAYAMQCNTVGGFNVAVGFDALKLSGIGCYNTILGASAMPASVAACYNTAVGYRSMFCNTVGANNLSIGAFAMEQNLDGGGNVAIGREALCTNVSGCCNIAIGGQALKMNISDANTAIGISALASNTLGGQNNAIGSFAMCANQTGSFNLAVGECALQGNVSGNDNIALGDNALNNNYDSNGNLAVGSCALCLATAANNIAIGKLSGSSVTTGPRNIFLGGCGAGITSGTQNLVLGNTANFPLPTCSCFILIGTNDQTYLCLNATCSLNIGTSGYGTAGQVLQSNGPTASPTWVAPGGTPPAQTQTLGTSYGCTSSGGFVSLGYQSAPSAVNTNCCNITAIGYRSLFSHTGGMDYTVVVGDNALCLANGAAIRFNTAIGSEALRCTTTSNSNVAIGHAAGQKLNGVSNTAVGTNAGNPTLGYTADGGTFIGANAGNSLSTGGCNIVITAGGRTGSAGISGTQAGEIVFETPLKWAQYNSGGGWFGSSDARLKEDIEDLALGLAVINEIQPRTFTWKATGVREVGFIAQEVDEVFSSVDPEGTVKAVKKDNPDNLGLSPLSFMPLVINSVKELSAKLDALEAENADLKARIAALETGG